jgi:hypothetical protein
VVLVVAVVVTTPFMKQLVLELLDKVMTAVTVMTQHQRELVAAVVLDKLVAMLEMVAPAMVEMDYNILHGQLQLLLEILVIMLEAVVVLLDDQT